MFSTGDLTPLSAFSIALSFLGLSLCIESSPVCGSRLAGSLLFQWFWIG